MAGGAIHSDSLAAVRLYLHKNNASATRKDDDIKVTPGFREGYNAIERNGDRDCGDKIFLWRSPWLPEARPKVHPLPSGTSC
jgi:hypothetical protein